MPGDFIIPHQITLHLLHHCALVLSMPLCLLKIHRLKTSNVSYSSFIAGIAILVKILRLNHPEKISDNIIFLLLFRKVEVLKVLQITHLQSSTEQLTLSFPCSQLKQDFCGFLQYIWLSGKGKESPYWLCLEMFA